MARKIALGFTFLAGMCLPCFSASLRADEPVASPLPATSTSTPAEFSGNSSLYADSGKESNRTGMFVECHKELPK